MRVVVALGGNALLERGEPMTAEVQRANVRTAAQALAPVAKEHQLVISHGNGPQVGLLALFPSKIATMSERARSMLDNRREVAGSRAERWRPLHHTGPLPWSRVGPTRA